MPQVTKWRMGIVCFISKATNTHFGYAIIIAFLWQQWVHERASVLRYTVRKLSLFCVRYTFQRSSAHKWSTSTVKLINIILRKLHPPRTSTP